ncbi:hypothetical protein CDEF62S_04788 [Castellaniella defragrans]
MLLIQCPSCRESAPRANFITGGEAGDIARPVENTGGNHAWGDYVFMRRNTFGLLREQWVHLHGCAPLVHRGARHAHLRNHEGRNFRPRPGGDAMSPTFRLPQGRHIRRDMPLRFTFNGKAYTGFQGDSAGVGLAGQRRAFRRAQLQVPPPTRHHDRGSGKNPMRWSSLRPGPMPCRMPGRPRSSFTTACRPPASMRSRIWGRDRMAVMQRLARFIPAGFYYKTFMWPRRMWGKYEEHIRDAAGSG